MAALLIPIAGLLYLGPYRDGLIDSELEALRMQAETLPARLAKVPLKPRERPPTGQSSDRSTDHLAIEYTWRYPLTPVRSEWRASCRQPISDGPPIRRRRRKTERRALDC